MVIVSKGYDVSRLANLRPGGSNVLYAPGVAGKDATDVFFSLHRLEVILHPQHARLHMSAVLGQSELVKPPARRALPRTLRRTDMTLPRTPRPFVARSLIAHALILNLELSRFGTCDFVDGLLNGGVTALPPTCNFGSRDSMSGKATGVC
ncbi:hypothetical protein PAXINDRAFT_97710 [Paxillus involutus ATCC 200175]|nr:hypothetical protein PAXINDRAFT_97710 [Paxillus involutus ATCC 200175]